MYQNRHENAPAHKHEPTSGEEHAPAGDGADERGLLRTHLGNRFADQEGGCRHAEEAKHPDHNQEDNVRHEFLPFDACLVNNIIM